MHAQLPQVLKPRPARPTETAALSAVMPAAMPLRSSQLPALYACLAGWLAGVASAGANVPRQALSAGVRAYRFFLKPWLGNVCPYEPSCSQYALTALQNHGAVAGSLLATGRLLRCTPWCLGGHDPVPTQAPRLFFHLNLGGTADPLPLNTSAAASEVSTAALTADSTPLAPCPSALRPLAAPPCTTPLKTPHD